MTLFGARSPPFASSDGVFLQAKCSKIKGWVEGWRSGKKLPFKRTTVCAVALQTFLPCFHSQSEASEQ